MTRPSRSEWITPHSVDAPSVLGPWLWRRSLLLRLCLRWTRGNLTEAEDLLSDACLRAMEAGQGGVAVNNPVSFSTTIIANLARDRRRASRYELERPASDSEPPLISPDATPYEHASARECLRRTLSALGGVPPRQRAALLLRSMGNDYACIAKEVGTSPQNARKMVQEARAKIAVESC